jgi:hypothetical protein
VEPGAGPAATARVGTTASCAGFEGGEGLAAAADVSGGVAGGVAAGAAGMAVGAAAAGAATEAAVDEVTLGFGRVGARRPPTLGLAARRRCAMVGYG